ncbi:MAG: GTPase Era [Burkholderiales bacterium]|jgi:GTP-binding protein Era
MTPTPEPHRCGYVAIIGRPNVGKSTLLNRLVGEKLSITSAKAQTTRHRIVGIVNTEQAQLLMLDTPGFQTRHRGALNRVLNRTASQAALEADVVVLVMDAHGWTPGDAQVLALVPQGKPVVLALNKIDEAGGRERLLPLLHQLSTLEGVVAWVPISARTGKQLDQLVSECAQRLPEGPAAYDEDTFTDRSERFLAAEAIREKLFRLMGDELPYQSTVGIEQFEQQGDLRRIFAAVIVEREAQRPIVLGASGERIKRIASEARQDLERLFGGPVYLEVWVKVRAGWSDNEQRLRTYGYE